VSVWLQLLDADKQKLAKVKHTNFLPTPLQCLTGKNPRFGTVANNLLNLTSGDASAEMTMRRAEEYDLAVATQRASGEQSSPNRPTPGDSSDSRRRQARGRNGSNRAGHALRPMSVGSARYVGSMMTHQASPHRAQISTPSEWTRFSLGQRTPNMPPELNAYFQQRERDSFNAAMNTQNAPAQTPPSNRPSSTFAASTEQPSPPVAVGSGEGLLRRGSEDPILGQGSTTGNMSADAPPFHPRNGDAGGSGQPLSSPEYSAEYLVLHNMGGMGGAAQPQWPSNGGRDSF
jgi:hypothetical protein